MFCQFRFIRLEDYRIVFPKLNNFRFHHAPLPVLDRAHGRLTIVRQLEVMASHRCVSVTMSACHAAEKQIIAATEWLYSLTSPKGLTTNTSKTSPTSANPGRLFGRLGETTNSSMMEKRLPY
jgi:hypothetical protein